MEDQTELPKSSLVFDFAEKEFKSSLLADPVIKLASPIGGFLFPSFTDNAVFEEIVKAVIWEELNSKTLASVKSILC